MAVEGIIANGVTEILKKLSSVVTNEITLVWDFKDELKNLRSTLNMVLAVMEDAEKKQLSSMTVRLWMEELKSIAYDAEDILDDYSYEVILRKRETFFNKVRNVFSSNSKPLSFVASWKLARKVKKLNDEFNKIAKRKNDLGLLTIDVSSSSSSSHDLMMKNRLTDSLVVTDWKFVGRENDKSTIIKLLVEDDEEEDSTNNQGGGGGGKHVSVIPIVGMGGLGKTTMAQQVYNDEVVQKHFDIKVWICVSDPFDIKKLWKNIANSMGIDMSDIACSLQNAFRGKKFIMVLDDVWNEKPADWNNFKKPFMVGREGSKILVTTRNEKVALIMVDKFQPYPLGILKENDCWSLFKEIAFGCAIAGAVETPKLTEIGKEMVKRCGGLPLAVIFLGSLMRSKNKEEEWKIIRDTKLWHACHEGKNSEILPSLRLSYDYLPSHLKLCFSYCCLFPKDWIIKRETLIQLWIAEGFIIETPGENTMSMEEIGNEYFHSLLSSFFFQDVKKDEDGNIATCKMHDLVHDLARSVVGNHECLIVENALDIDYISEATRRLNLSADLGDDEILPKVLEAIKKAKKLRTIFVIEQTIDLDIGNAFKENKGLRVLDLSGSRVTSKSTSSSIVKSKHLRYLHVEEALFPKGMIGQLCFLQTLRHFDVGRNKNAGGIEELEAGLNLLRDLSITNLQNVTSVTNACRANLKEKKNLRGLNLTWDYDHHANANEAMVLEGLRPHPNLRTLCIDGFKGSKLPRWIQEDSSSCLPNLVGLTLEHGYKFEQLAGIGSLPSLKKLTLNNLSTLEEWATTNNCFPLLEEITIMHCPVLTTITPTTTIFPSLKVLILRHIDGRAAKTLVTNNLNYSLTSLRLHFISNLITLPRQGLMENNNTLLSLEIISCPVFKGFLPPNKDEDDDEDQGQQLQEVSQVVSSSSGSSSALQSLQLYRCPVLRFYPNIRSLTSLRALEIQECKESSFLQEELTCVSSSCSLLENLEHVTIVKKDRIKSTRREVVFEWKKGVLLRNNEAPMHYIAGTP